MKIYFTKIFTNDEDDCDNVLNELHDYFYRTIEDYGVVSLFDLEKELTDLFVFAPDYSDIPFKNLKLGYDNPDVNPFKIILRKRRSFGCVKGFRLEFQFAFINFKNLD